MFHNMNLSESYLKDYNLRKEAKKQYALTQKNVAKIKTIALKLIKYPEYADAYDYVDNLFPRVKVKNISIYKVAARDLAKMGYGGAEGFYDTISRIVVLCGARPPMKNIDKRYQIVAKIEKDDVIVHELCHYCFYAEGKTSVSSELREEFAYGWSVGYLRQRGLTDEQIVKYNFLPYLVGLSYDEAVKNILVQNGISSYEYNNHTRYQRKEFSRQYYGKVFRRAKEIAIERGHRLIDIYSKKLEEGTGLIDEEVDVDRFDILDL